MVCLAAAAFFFPKEGLTIGGTTIRLPWLTEVVNSAEAQMGDVFKSPEELERERQDTLRKQKIVAMRKQLQSASNPITMPRNNQSYLDTVFASFLGADSSAVRVMFYGDSQLEGDRMTCILRQYVHTTFSGTGPGMLPAAMPATTYTCSEQTTPAGLMLYRNFGPKAWHADHYRYGPMAQMVRVDGTATLRYKTTSSKQYTTSQTFRRITVVTKGTGSVSVSLDGQMQTLVATTVAQPDYQLHSITLPTAVSEATLTLSGAMDVYGVQLDAERGVAVDNVAQRGSSGTIFTSIDTTTIEPYYRAVRVPLIIMQYGANMIPGTQTDAQLTHFVDEIRQQIHLFKQISPASRIVFLGPADMSRRDGGQWVSYPMIERIDSALCQAANAEGAAYWSMYKAMGGNGSMARWVDAKPSLGSPDHIHYSAQGADSIATLFTEAFDRYYKYYHVRRFGTEPKRKPAPATPKQPADSTRKE